MTTVLTPSGTERIAKDLPAHIAALLTLDSYAMRTEQQPKFDLKMSEHPALFAKIRSHQKDAKENVRDVPDSLSPDVIHDLSKLNALTRRYRIFGGKALAAIPQILTRPTARGDALRYLGRIETSAKKLKFSVDSAAKDLGKFHDVAQDDAKNLASDLAEANKVLGATGGDLKKIQGQIADLESKIRGDIALTVTSALTTVGGVVMIGVGVALTVGATSGGPGPFVILTGIGMTVGGVGGLAASASKLHGDNETLFKLYLKAANLRSQLAVLQNIQTALASQQASVDAIAKSSGVLKEKYSLSTAFLEDVKQAVTDAKTSSEVEAIRDAFSTEVAEWKKLETISSQCKDKIRSIQPQVVKNIFEMKAPKTH